MIRQLAALSLTLLIFASCNRMSERHWSAALPEFTPFAILAPSSGSPAELLYGEHMDLLDTMTPANREKTQRFLQYVTSDRVRAEALVILPHTADDWMPVLVLQTPRDLLPAAQSRFSRPYTGNSYRFGKARIVELYLSETDVLYAVQLHNWVLVSESSRAIEEMVRAYTGIQPSLKVTDADLQPGRVLINAGHLDRFAALETAVRYRPRLKGAFAGAGVTIKDVVNQPNATGSGTPKLSFNGDLPLDAIADRATLIRALTTRNHTNILDRYVSQDATAMALLSRPPDMVFHDSESEAPADRYLRNNNSVFTALAQSLSPNFAFAAFASSGLTSVGETAYLRLLEDRPAFLREINRMLENGAISEMSGSTYLVRGASVARLISGGLATFDIHYLTISGDAVIITQRPALSQKLVNDRSRRRTLYFEENYLTIRRQFNEQLSGFLYVQREDFVKYAESLLNTSNSVDILVSQFDVFASGLYVNANQESARWITRTYEIEQTTRPFEERWLVSLDGTDIAGTPVFAQLGGSGTRNGVIAATEGGTVVALAADGTQVFRVSTQGDTPVGSPVAFDWYANNQTVILQGAGNKIYAWNSNGNILPNFPIVLNEPITAPIRIADVTRNGLPEIVVATSDRMVHVLDQRGNNISGWPQSVNAAVRTQPIVESIGNRRVIFAYAENVVFAWDNNGTVRSGFPVFYRAPLRGPLFYHSNHLLAGTADGAIIAIGSGEFFASEHAVPVEIGESAHENTRIQAVELTNGSITLRPAISSHRVDVRNRNDEGNETTTSHTDPMIFAMADNGSIFGISQRGALRFTQSMGQPAMSGTPPLVADISGNGRAEVLGVANFGRMYAWDIQLGDRFLNIPTTAIRFPAVTDLVANGRMEIVAGTRDGLRAWTINQPSTPRN
ncbi:MAG: hypothetical protein LAT52_06995 [Balneolales bacterium]|nr:hypothetical protein [Balneolales bacterium]